MKTKNLTETSSKPTMIGKSNETCWSSITQPIKVKAIAYSQYGSHGINRIETVCNTCDAHLGHVFPDGFAQSDLRYCINGVALKKEEAKKNASQ